jgi:ABC-type transporter Mla maintaining outer membrane lipid asymmetry ATPase subunit MlaF
LSLQRVWEFFDWNEADARHFFGREALTSQLLDQVRTTNFMGLVGASGNGKSSVLRAGLLYQLQLGKRIAGSDQWQILLMRPDAQPMQHLAEALFAPGTARNWIARRPWGAQRDC